MNWYSYLFFLCSAVVAIPSCIAVYLRYRKPHILETHAEKVPPGSTLDKIFQMMLVPYLFYYVLDSCALVYLYHRLDICNFAFLLHHVITLIGMPSLLSTPYYPWFLIAPVAFHNFLIWFPTQTWLNYVYLALILRMYYGMMQPPWIKQRLYVNSLIIAISLLVLPIFLMWLFECSNDMENTNFD